MATYQTGSIYTYWDEWDCPLCGKRFQLTRFRQSRLRTLKRDGDHHHWYADGQSTVRFYVVVCPHCGYAAGENHFVLTDPKEISLLRKHNYTIGIKLTEDINIDRTEDARVASCFGHAIRQTMIGQFPASILAGLYLRAAWFCREIEDQDQEQAMLQLAYKNYETAFEREPLPIGPMTRLGLIYILGELSRRIEDYQRSSYWFGEGARLRDDLKAEPNLAKLLTEQHQLMREEYKKKQAKASP